MPKSIEGGRFEGGSLERVVESREGAESNEYPKIVLHFLRHSIKEKTGKEVEDQDIPISEAGRELAAQKFDNAMNLRFGHTAGSPRVRTLETAAVAATKDSEMNPDDLGIGKSRKKEALDFAAEDTVYGNKFIEAYKQKRTLSFLVEESDDLAEKTGDTISSTYSRMAANIAGIILKNHEVAVRGVDILDKSKNPANEKNDFERILATHATVQECFLLKLVEKTKGKEERDTLLSLIGEDGFDFVEGFDVNLTKENGEVKIRITYKKGDYSFDETVPVEILKEIIAEKK